MAYALTSRAQAMSYVAHPVTREIWATGFLQVHTALMALSKRGTRLRNFTWMPPSAVGQFKQRTPSFTSDEVKLADYRDKTGDSGVEHFVTKLSDGRRIRNSVQLMRMALRDSLEHLKGVAAYIKFVKAERIAQDKENGGANANKRDSVKSKLIGA
eukprot:GHVU01115173.1.p1 GENE.GHVU01115173.1~~GHVU01115173.1.p1  ORF type:complete len:156 (+),score=9.45 GHVU01115173.1:194-661(+)